VHEPGGAHPSSVQGRYGRDHAFYSEYHAATKTAAASDAWLQRWVRDVDGRAAFLERLGNDRWRALEVRGSRPAAPVNYSAT